MYKLCGHPISPLSIKVQKMQKSFYEYLKPTLWMCNYCGICYNIPIDRTVGYLQNITTFLLALPYFIIHFAILMCITIMGIPSGNPYYRDFTNVMKINNKFGFINGSLFVYTKGIYYLIRRSEVKDLLLQVRENFNIPLSYPNKCFF